VTGWVAPAGSLELGCTWPLQARMLDLRFSPPVVLSVFRKSAIFFVAWAGSFKTFVIIVGGTIAVSFSMQEQNSIEYHILVGSLFAGPKDWISVSL
jgi:hypothetical protein